MSSTTTTAAPNTRLLQNMMRSHENRNPYDDYLVLDVIGRGSIGSVEKVVRKHHRVTPRGGGGDGGGDCDRNFEKEKCCVGLCEGALFAGCRYGSTANGRNKKGAKKKYHPRSKSCFLGFFSKLFYNRDAFRPTATISDQHSDLQRRTPDGSISIVSESSAFSAPSTPTIPRRTACATSLSPRSNGVVDRSGLRSTSQHDPILPGLRRRTATASRSCATHPLRRYALKSIRIDRMTSSSSSSSSPSADEDELRNEVSILRSLDHPHIVHIIETYEYRGNIYLVIDLCENGDLYAWDPYGEGEARGIVRQLLRAASYMHRRGIVHRDLKYENVMFSDRERSKLEIKLIDFGLSMKYGRLKGKLDMSVAMTDFVGTIYTMAPEVIKGSYTYKCDLWSIGIMAYMLLSSHLPFSGNDIKTTAWKITRGNYSFSGRRWSNTSKKSRDFVSSLLVLSASARPTADQALKHPWLAGGGTSFNSKGTLHRQHSSETVGGAVFVSLTSPPERPFSSQICTSIENYSRYSWMHRLALMVIAYRYTGEETTQLLRIFTSYDDSDNGTIDVKELRNVFALHGKYNEDEIDQIFMALDMTGSGKISWTEFLASTIETKGQISEEEFASAFEHLDFDKNGYISTSDLREIVGRDLPQNIVDKIIRESDIIGDNKIWKDEFLALGEESNAVWNMDNQQGKDANLKRSKSADDFDLVNTRSLIEPHSKHSEEDVLDQFYIEKAKSVRKATVFV